jgi:hypothetical protein
MRLTASSASVGHWQQATQRAKRAWYANTSPSTDLTYLQCHASTDEHIGRPELILSAQLAAKATLWNGNRCSAMLLEVLGGVLGIVSCCTVGLDGRLYNRLCSHAHCSMCRACARL